MKNVYICEHDAYITTQNSLHHQLRHGCPVTNGDWGFLPLSTHKIYLLTLYLYVPLVYKYKALNGHAPQYLAALISKYVPSRPFRSEDQYLLNSPRWRLKTFGNRVFTNAAPTLWNPLPLSVKQAPSIDSFKARLKSYPFNKAFWYFVCVIPWPVHDEHYKALLSIVSRHAWGISAI